MWILYSFIAAVLWGLDYTITGRVLEKIRLPTLLCIELFFGFVGMLALALISGSYKADLHEVFSSKSLLICVVLIVIIFNTANALIVLSIADKNATLAGLIEISYPLFIALFSWLLLGETDLNLGVTIGGSLVLLGVTLVYICSK